MSRSSLSALANWYKDYDSKPEFAAVNDLRVSGSEVFVTGGKPPAKIFARSRRSKKNPIFSVTVCGSWWLRLGLRGNDFTLSS